MQRLDWNPGQSPSCNARRVLPGLARDFFGRGRSACAGEATAARLHRLRLAGKRFRYCLELFRECYGPSMNERLKRLKRVQRLLGVISDCDATERLVSAEAPGQSDDARRLLLFLRARSDASCDAFAAFWREQFDGPGEEAAWIDFLSGAGQAGRD